MPINFSQIISQLSTGRQFKSNVLTPLAWGGLLIIPLCFYGLFTVESPIIQAFCGLMIIAFALYYARQYEYWKKKDPDRLQSEWLVLEKMKTMMGIKGQSPEPIEGKEIVNPPAELTEGNNDE